MRILFVSKDAFGADLAWRLQQEGHLVKFYIENKAFQSCYDGIISYKIKNWKKELDWVKKDGLILFDSSGFGKIQDKLRKAGYKVVGGSEIGDLLENNRNFGQRIFSQVGMETAFSRTFSNVESAIDFVKRHPDRWVIKQNGQLKKSLNYVGKMDDGRDVISMLSFYQKTLPKRQINFDLQKRVQGVEIGVGRYFNGKDWVGPIEFNIEHKSLFAGGLGPKTDEMGTVMWYDDDENNPIYQATIFRMKKYLHKIGFVGDFEINCIVNAEHIYPLEATSRFGDPALQMQTQIHLSPWGEFLSALGNKKTYALRWRRGEGLVVLIATPPFPYQLKDKKQSSDGIKIIIDDELLTKKRKNLHFQEVLYSAKESSLVVVGSGGYVLHMSNFNEDLVNAQEELYQDLKKVHIPKMFYRHDIGEKFIQQDRKKLEKWKLI